MSQVFVSHLKSAAIFVRNSNPLVVLNVEPEGIRVKCSAMDSKERVWEADELVDWNRIESSTGENQIMHAAVRVQQNVKEAMQ